MREFGSGIAVANVSQKKSIITCSLFSDTGELLSTRNFNLGVREKFALTHNQIFENMAIPQFSGYVEISGTELFKSFGLYWVLKQGKIVAVSMIPQQ